VLKYWPVCVFGCVAVGHNSSDYIHVFVEAVRLALTDVLRYLGDPAHVTIPLETLLDKSYSQQRAQHINMDRCVLLLAAHSWMRQATPGEGQTLKHFTLLRSSFTPGKEKGLLLFFLSAVVAAQQPGAGR